MAHVLTPPIHADAKLIAKALLSVVLLVAIMVVLTFVPAGTLRYPEGWAVIALFVVGTLASTVYLMLYDPELLERRLRFGAVAETQPRQKVIQVLANVCFVASIVVPAFDHRFRWSQMSLAWVVIGDVLIVLGYLLVFFVFRENKFASSVIETSADQRVIDTGPYSIVRHPMYAAAFVLLPGVPLGLRSWWGLLTIVPMLAALIWRLRDEEAFLRTNLPGYADYQSRVRYRLIPYLW